MLRYLNTAAHTFKEGLAARMVQHGNYVLIPPSHGYYNPLSQTLVLSSAFYGLHWEAYNKIGEDSENKLALAHQYK